MAQAQQIRVESIAQKKLQKSVETSPSIIVTGDNLAKEQQDVADCDSHCFDFSAIGSAHAAEPFRIGVLEDMSGLYSDITGRGSVVAAQFAVEDFGGKVLGRPIELITADHLNKA